MKIGVIIKNFFDFMSVMRRWTVEGNDWCGGQFHSYWLYSKAVAALSEYVNRYPFVDIKDEASDFRVRVKNNPDNLEPPPVILTRPFYNEGFSLNEDERIATTCSFEPVPGYIGDMDIDMSGIIRDRGSGITMVGEPPIEIETEFFDEGGGI